MSRFNVILVGAGEINFGSPEGPWNHSLRLEKILGDSLNVVSLVDPDIDRSKARVKDKRASTLSDVSKAWTSTLIHADLHEAAQDLAQEQIDLIVVGCPPHFRGTTLKGKDTDVQMLKLFPQARGYLIEKPVAAVNPFSRENDCDAVASAFRQWQNTTGGVVSIGYMLRYNKAILKVRELLAQNNLVPTCINARYFMAYEYARKLSWWNKSVSCGPVVEQATHFVDLIRFLAGPGNEAMLETVRTTTVKHHEEAGKLAKLGFDESEIPVEERVPRVTSSFWKHQRGTIGSLTHGITLHGTTYDTEIEVLADGWIMRVRNAYDSVTTLAVRRPGEKHEQILHIPDDPFLSEFETVIGAYLERSSSNVNQSPAQLPLSDFEDALKTYKLTWRIRLTGEE